jgi:hypothetical protein
MKLIFTFYYGDGYPYSFAQAPEKSYQAIMRRQDGNLVKTQM